MYVTDKLKIEQRSDLETNAECVWLEVDLSSSRQILIGNFYRPPGGPYAKENFMEYLERSLATAANEKKEILLLGDFNCDMTRPNAITKKLQSILKAYGLTQIIKEPTRVTKGSSTLIDIIATTHLQYIQAPRVINNSLSDHHTVACTYSLMTHCEALTAQPKVSVHFPLILNETLQKKGLVICVGCVNIELVLGTRIMYQV